MPDRGEALPDLERGPSGGSPTSDANLGSRSVRGGIVTAGAQGAKVVLNAAAIVVMARLLAPEDFGLVAMVTPILALIALFQDMGLSAATIQRDSITQAQSSTLFWINVLLSLILAVAVVVLSPLVTWFYGDPRLLPITMAFGGLVLCSGLTAQHLALMKRRMQFALLAKLDVASLAAGLAMGVGGAWLGLSYWAIIISTAGKAVVLLMLVWVAAAWRPGPPARGCGIRPMLRFGRNLTLVNIGNFLIQNLDSVLIGKAWGGAALGLYDRAYSLLRLYMQFNVPVNSVAIPVLSRLQNDLPRYRTYYIHGLGIITGFSMPFIAFMAANAEDVVRLMLGEKWLGAVPLFLGLAPAAFVSTFNGATWWIYSSLGQTGRQLRWALLVQCPITVFAYFAGLPYGPLGVAIAYSCVTVGLRLPAIIYCLRDFPIGLRDVLSAIFPAAWSSLAAAGATVAVKWWLLSDRPGPVEAVAVDLALYGSLYLLFYCALSAGRRNLSTYGGIVRGLLHLPSSAKAVP